MKRVRVHRHQLPHRRLAFSFVEMIVVMAIISLLIAVTLPAIGKARQSARRVQCVNNLRNRRAVCLVAVKQGKFSPHYRCPRKFLKLQDLYTNVLDTLVRRNQH